jgi:hypothetical protein
MQSAICLRCPAAHILATDGSGRSLTRHTCFIDKERLKAAYLWEGEVLDGRPTPEAEKSGLVELELRMPPVLSLPMTGNGRVKHVRESREVKFEMRRVTKGQLKEHGLPFTMRKLRIIAHHEEES